MLRFYIRESPSCDFYLNCKSEILKIKLYIGYSENNKLFSNLLGFLEKEPEVGSMHSFYLKCKWVSELESIGSSDQPSVWL